MSSLVQLEPLVNSTTKAFISVLTERYVGETGGLRVCDFGKWLQFYAFDVIGELTFSKRLGFLDKGEDVDGIIELLETSLDYASIVGQIPILDYLFKKNPVRLWASRRGLLNTSAPIVTFALNRLEERRDELESMATDRKSGESNASDSSQGADFLIRYWKAHLKDPDFMTQERVLAVTVANIDELRIGYENGTLQPDGALFSWMEVKDLPFLDAVIKEGLRIHPAVGLPLERIVPPQGQQICGKFIPGGTTVGCSAWTLHRSSVFGEKPEEFRPRRWLDASADQLKAMDKAFFSFGAGARTCIGKNISLLEMYKLVPALLTTFNFDLADKEQPWTLRNSWFVKQSDFNVYIRKR
ncbi:Pisatin demethylase [Cyphellophora attinorum]|uniref:Pisatin demethylase n=1 Tax=Cyphellophora attinorum TaxID=1664694 RepID=A0A0N1NZE4_9EURO|nr:Pisatin demethylase [Phialophora attinorum]KPI40815.1 Pisatin demethylase [Phialophora attinorum]